RERKERRRGAWRRWKGLPPRTARHAGSWRTSQERNEDRRRAAARPQENSSTGPAPGRYPAASSRVGQQWFGTRRRLLGSRGCLLRGVGLAWLGARGHLCLSYRSLIGL